jgi:hypothetical protein
LSQVNERLSISPIPHRKAEDSKSEVAGFTIRQVMAKGEKMLQTIAIILIILWVLGFVSSYTMGGLIHILLVIAVIMILVNVIGGRRL